MGSGITGDVLQSRALVLVDCRPVRLLLGSSDGLGPEESDLISVLGVQAVSKPRKSNPIHTHTQVGTNMIQFTIVFYLVVVAATAYAR